MSGRVERFVSPGRGNGLRARHQIRTGELIYSADPLSSCVYSQAQKIICHNCFSRSESLLRCSHCKTVCYCDARCQKAAWSAHKRECRCLRRFLPKIPPDLVRLASRIIFRLLDPAWSSSSGDNGDQLYSLEEHESHLGDYSEAKTEDLINLVSALRLYLQQEVPDFTREVGESPLLPPGLDPVGLLARVMCNCFSISDGELQEIGVGLYPSMSLLNHDCRPCCVVTFEGTRLHLRALRDIRPLEELTIGYVETLAPSAERRRKLQEQYHFLCSCQRCSTKDMDDLMLAGEEVAWTPLREAIPRLEKLQAEQEWEGILEACSSLLGSVGGAGPEGNVHRLRVTDLALNACINLELWDSALAYGSSTLQPYSRYYPDPHPAHAIQLVNVGMAQYFLFRLQEALDTFGKAYDILKITHGNQHPLTSSLSRKLEECRAKMGRGA